MSVLWSCIVSGSEISTCQKVPSTPGGHYMLAIFTLCLSFRTMAVKSSLIIVFISPHFSFIVFQKSVGMPFGFGLTVPRQFVVLLCKLSSSFGNEKKLSVYTLCPTFSVAHFLSLL